MACASKLPMLLSTPSPLLCPRPSLIHLSRLTHLPRTSLSIAVSGGQHRAPSSFSCYQSRQGFLLRAAAEQVHTATSTAEDCIAATHPYPEWVKMVEHVTAGGYAGRQGVDEEDAFSAPEGLPEEFTTAAGACLLFAREKPHLLRCLFVRVFCFGRLLPRRDVEVLVENGSPSLFENKVSSVRRMKAFISSDGSNELGSEQACTVDVVRYLLSYLCNSLGKNGGDDTKCRELVERSVRSLLSELVKADSAVQEPNSTSSSAGHTSLMHDKSQRPPDQKTGVKRGDWICPKCSFINFSRNTECLECKEARPRKQLTGQEWECPQCDFFNHGRNMACLRCDCKCPEKILASERKLGNDQSVQRSGSEGLVDAGNSMGGLESWKSTESAISQKLDRILGRSSSTSETKDTGNQSVLGQAGVRTGRRFTSPEIRDPGYVPFVPLPADMFRQKPTEEQPSVKEDNTSVKADELVDTLTQGSGSAKPDESSFSEEFSKLTVGRTNRESSDPSETLSRNPTQLSDDTNVSGSMSDDDFPEIMPMRKGENRFVVSKKKDRSLTSPQYKRRMALEQANNSSFVPFVPFPPDYFAKDKQSKDGSLTNKSAAESSSAVAGNAISIPQNDEEDKAGGTIWGGSANIGQTESTKANRNKVDSDILLSNRAGTVSSESSQEITAKVSGLDREVENAQVAAQSGGRVFPRKSLEGSAVTEPDPLDMSEEAKAQRWFRRVAQINDISELSKIPDEDFPEIMPMRKGINRFVVSKRKTPLERRLTSQQYRRNLPIVSSEPEKDSS